MLWSAWMKGFVWEQCIINSINTKEFKRESNLMERVDFKVDMNHKQLLLSRAT